MSLIENNFSIDKLRADRDRLQADLSEAYELFGKFASTEVDAVGEDLRKEIRSFLSRLQSGGWKPDPRLGLTREDLVMAFTATNRYDYYHLAHKLKSILAEFNGEGEGEEKGDDN